MPQVIVRLRPGSHYGRFCQLSVKEGTLSVITPRFLMRVVFHKFLKFGSSAETSEILKCMVEQTDFGKIKIKTKDTTSGAVKAIHLT